MKETLINVLRVNDTLHASKSFSKKVPVNLIKSKKRKFRFYFSQDFSTFGGLSTI